MVMTVLQCPAQLSEKCSFLRNIYDRNKVFDKNKTGFVLCIRKTCTCNLYPLKPHFYIANLGFAGVYLFFSSPEPLGSQGELIL